MACAPTSPTVAPFLVFDIEELVLRKMEKGRTLLKNIGEVELLLMVLDREMEEP